jgi:hypothetical protein
LRRLNKLENTNKDIYDEENQEHDLEFYSELFKGLIEIYRHDLKENE